MMDCERPQNDPFSECGSDYRLGSQPRKISRGILVDSSAKFRAKSGEQDDIVLTEVCKIHGKSNLQENEIRMELVNNKNVGKGSQALKQDMSLLSARAFCKGNSKAEVSDKHEEVEKAQATFSATHRDKIPGFQDNDRPESQPKRVTCVSEDRNADVTNKLFFAPAQPVMTESKRDKAVMDTETLRISLWKILETVSSPPKHHLNDCNLKNASKDSNSSRKNNREVSSILKSKPPSDTIESDSDSPNNWTTLSLSRKRTSSKLKGNRKTDTSTYIHKGKRRKRTFSSREGFTARQSFGNTGGSSIFKYAEKKRDNCATGTCKMLFSEQENQGENQQAPSRRQSIPNTRDGFYCQENSEFVNPETTVVEKGSAECLLGDTSEHLKRVHNSPNLPENVDFQEDLVNSFLKNRTVLNSDAESPTTRMQRHDESLHPGFSSGKSKAPSNISSPGSPLKYVSGSEAGKLVDHLDLEIFGTEGIKSFKNLVALRRIDYQPDPSMNSSKKHDAGKLQGTCVNVKKPTTVEEPENAILKGVKKDCDSEASEEDWDRQGSEESELFSSKNLLRMKEASVLCQDVKQCHRDGYRCAGFSSNSALQKGAYAQNLDLANQQDEFSRGIALFSLALERVKRKMKSVARKRSAGVLQSVVDRIHSQMQNTESHIQADVNKLISFSISKRKRLEMRLQELEEEFNIIHRSFKEEVSRKLQNCKAAVEGLEAHQLEFKVAVQKQRASHRKLLLQAEEAIETDLVDAQKRIYVIQNMVTGKMLQLKNVVAECLKECSIS